MECDICLIEWNSERVPRLLNCGHTFCELCIKAMFLKSKSLKMEFVCPTCKTPQKIKSVEEVGKLIKNFGLITFAEKFKNKEERPSCASLMSMTEGFKKDKPEQIKESFKKINKEGMDLNFNINKRCSKHNLPFHSKTKEGILLCSKCILEKKVKSEPLEGVFEDLKKRIDSTQFRAFMAKNQITHITKFLKTYLQRFEKENTLQLEKVFDYYHQVINFFYESRKQILNKCISHQKKKIEEFINEIDLLMQEIQNIEKDLSFLNNMSDKKILLNSIDKIRRYQGRMINFLNFDHEFDLFSMKICFKEEERKNLFSALQNSLLIDLDSLQIQGKSPTVGQILEIDSTWNCICGEFSNPINVIKCTNCGLMRRLETFNTNFSDTFEDIEDLENEKELNLINERRKIEMKEYEDIVGSNDQNEEVFLISSKWLKDWEIYIKNNKEDAIYTYIDKIAGVLPPGPIYNDDLIERNKDDQIILKQKIKEGKDFKVVAPNIWDFFFLNYNGGPFIRLSRKNLNKIGSKDNNYYVLNPNALMDYNTMKEQYFNDAEEDGEEDKAEEKEESSDTIVNMDEEIQVNKVDLGDMGDFEDH